MSDTQRIAKNTLMLYFRQILIMIVSLYTVRVVLNVLGAQDYGIYNVVAGVVTMFSFVSSSMATASQRYFSYDIGKNDIEHLKTTFSITFQIYIFISLIVFILAETLGVWIINNKLIIPDERIIAANWIYQSVIISFLLSLITTPYTACIIAHEKMNIYAYISIIETVLKLLIVFLLRIIPYDKLIVYGLLHTSVLLINTTLYRLYCHRKYEECKIHLIKDFPLFKEIISYSGWNLFGSMATIAKTQSISWVINIFYGPIINASNAIAIQIRNVLRTFSNNFSLAVRPQIIKNYANKKYNEVHQFICFSSKITYFLNLIILSCLFSNIDFILQIWLKQVPDYTLNFVKLLLIELLVESISYPMASANQATGKIALYQFLIGIIVILNVPFSIIITKIGYDANYIYIGSIVFMSLISILRFLFLIRIQDFNLKYYILKLFIPVLIPTIIIFISQYFIKFTINSYFICLIDLFCKGLLSVLIIFIFGFSKDEKYALIKNIKNKILRVN